jgi:hypothetical protein
MIVISPDHYSNRSSELVTGRNRFGAFFLPPGYDPRVGSLYKCPPLQRIGLGSYQHIPDVFKLQFLNE